MKHPVISHPYHGDYAHNIYLFVAEMLCMEKEFKFLNGEWFQSKHLYPGIPDIYIEQKYKGKDDRGSRCTLTKKYVIEIETNASKASIEKKKAQFESSTVGHEMIVIPMNKMPDADKENIFKIREFIDRYLPAREI